MIGIPPGRRCYGFLHSSVTISQYFGLVGRFCARPIGHLFRDARPSAVCRVSGRSSMSFGRRSSITCRLFCSGPWRTPPRPRSFGSTPWPRDGFDATDAKCGPRWRPPKSDRRTLQRTPKIDRVMSSIKVVDSTHALFGKTLKLLSEQCGRGKAFVAVGLKDGRRRLMLRSATDLDSRKRHVQKVPCISARSLLPLARHIQCCLTGLTSEALHESRPSSRADSPQLESPAQPSTASATAGSAATRSPKSARSADRSDPAAYSRRGPRSC